MPTGRRVGRHDLGAQVGRCAHDALSVRTGEQDAELVGERHQFVLRAADLRRRPRRSRRDVRNAARDALGRARAQQVGVRGGGRADEHEVDRVVRELGDVGDGLDAEHLLALEVGAVHAARVPAREQVVQRHEAELARVGRCPGDQHASWARTGRGTARRWGGAGCGGPLRRHGVPISTRPSTATSEPSGCTISGLMSTLATSGRSAARRPSPTISSTQLLAVDRRLASERAEQLLGREVVDHARRP